MPRWMGAGVRARLPVLVGLVGAGCSTATFECRNPESEEVVFSETMSCDEFREVGYQRMGEAEGACSQDAACECGFVSTCRGTHND